MTEKQMLDVLFDYLNIGTQEERENGLKWGISPASYNIVLQEGMKNVDGYGGFFCTFTFDEEGNFSGLGIWE